MSNQPEQDDDFIINESGGSYEKPPTGKHQLVLVDIISIMMPSKFDNNELKKKLEFVFQIETETGARRIDGTRFEIERLFTPSLSSGGGEYSPSGLFTFTQQWFGKPIPEDQRRSFDVRRLLGQNGEGNITMNEKGRIELSAISPWSERMGPKIAADNYVRRERKAWKKPDSVTPVQSRAAVNAQAPLDKFDDAIPF